MLRRCLGLAIAGVFFLGLTPVWGQGVATYDKDAVKALSKKIDNHLAKVWKKAKVAPAARAEDHVFFRRLNLDLVGRIPDLINIQDFLDDDRPEKRWEWVDRFLDGDEHPRHFANVWRQVMLGQQTNQQAQFLMPQFEAWLRDRITQNVTLDKLVQQILTNNPGNPNMGFQPNQPVSPQLFFVANENKAENLAGATSRVFLGVKIECAQCHAHPFAKWKQDQFWEFAAFFSGQQQVNRPGGLGRQPNVAQVGGREILIPGTDKVVKAKFLTGKAPDWNKESGNARKILADWVTAKNNPYFAKAMADHIWAYLMGVSLLEPIMEPSDDNLMTHPELLDDLAKGLMDNNFDAKFLIRAIVHSDAYQRASGGTKLADKEDYQLFVRMPIRALSPEQIWDSVYMATNGGKKQDEFKYNPQQFFNPNQMQTPRAQFLSKFANQDRRHEPQTSILQALFMMNGKYMAEKTKVENNHDLKALAREGINGGHAGRITSLYRLVLSRPPRQGELDRLIPYLERGGATGNLGEALSDVYWSLLNSSEFLHNH
ncbi:MAG TPA: DUF1549 domain-containing protein [Gemmataceae bacterium]|nr:DUF1549 domain-containing protein [Gemmataceae bacterium]